MIDQLQVATKAQILENNTMGRSLASALQKASIPRPASAHRAPLINHFLEQVILQSPSDENKNIKTIAFGGVIKLNPHNRNPLLKPYSAFIALSCTQFHYSGMHLVAPYENDSIIFFLSFPQTTKNKKGKKYPSHKNYIINEENEEIEIMIDQLQVATKAQILENNTMGRSLASALQKASIPRPASAHRALLINH